MNVSTMKENSGVSGAGVADYARKLQSSRPSDSNANDDHVAKASKAAVDPIFLNNIKPVQAREFLLSNINRSIADYTPKPQANQPSFVRNFPTPEAATSQIIDSVNQAAKNIPAPVANASLASDITPSGAADSGKSLADLINKIQDGFRQTKEALDQLGPRASGFNTELGQIQQKVSDFLQFLTDPENNALPASSPETITTTETAASYESYQSSSQTSIQIQTRDGDTVTIDLANSFSQQQSVSTLQSSSQGENQSSAFSGFVYEASTKTANSFSFTVNGSLDEGELQAINALVGDIGKTIGQFEKNNVDAALNIAKNIDQQSSELSSFSFNVKTSEQFRAIDLYQKTQVTSPAGHSAPAPASTAAPAPAKLDLTAAATPPTIPSPPTSAVLPAESPTTIPANGSIESIFSNNISNILSAAENAGILNAAETVNKIFDKFYAQLDAQNKKIESMMALNESNKEAQKDTEPHT